MWRTDWVWLASNQEKNKAAEKDSWNTAFAIISSTLLFRGGISALWCRDGYLAAFQHCASLDIYNIIQPVVINDGRGRTDDIVVSYSVALISQCKSVYSLNYGAHMHILGLINSYHLFDIWSGFLQSKGIHWEKSCEYRNAKKSSQLLMTFGLESNLVS